MLSAAVGSFATENDIGPVLAGQQYAQLSSLAPDSDAAVELSVAVWPDVFDVNQVIDLNLQMDPGDLANIQSDETFSIEVPALLSADGETPILVAIRRKSGDSVGGKLSYKIDINELVSGQEWRGLRKLSLENGDDQDVVTEGFSWHMHRAAAEHLASDYHPGMASWINLHINGALEGIYVNVEQVDKQFLKNRGVFIDGATWLYKQSDIGGGPELKVGSGDSPTFDTLSYSPFRNNGKIDPTPDDATLETQLTDLIDMEGMLTLGAVNAFTGNNDALFTKGKNFYFADFLLGKRLYLPWDLDSPGGGSSITSNIYGPDKDEYQEILLNHSVFRAQYNEIMLDLLSGPLSPGSLIAFLDQIEPVLTDSLNADPNSKVAGSVASHFDELRSWVEARHANVLQQVLDDTGGSAPQSVSVDSLSTNDAAPELTGTVSDPAATIVVTVGGNTFAATNNGDSTWTLPDNTISPPLPDGTYDVQVTATDSTSNTWTDSTTDELTVDVTPPTVVAVVRNDGNENFDQLVSLAFTFDEDVSGSLDDLDLSLMNTRTATTVDLSLASVTWDGGANTATWDLAGVISEIGFHDVTLLGANLSDMVGNLLDGNGDMTGGDDFQTTLLVAVPGDIDLDGDVDSADILTLLAANSFGNPDDRPYTWAEGDFNGDGLVESDDILLILSTNQFGAGPYAAIDSTKTDSTLSATISGDGVDDGFSVKMARRRTVPPVAYAKNGDKRGAIGAAQGLLAGDRLDDEADVLAAPFDDPRQDEHWDTALRTPFSPDDELGS